MAQREPKAFPIGPLRYLSLIAAVFSLLGSALMFLGGAGKSIKAVRIFFLNETLTTDPPPPAYLDSSDQALVAVLQSMDAFLIALVLLIFSFGVYKLFIAEVKTPKNLPGAPWAQITSIEGLKKVLVEVILVILAVLFLWEVVYLEAEASWTVLVLPLSIVLIAAALKLVDWRSD